MAKEKTYAEKLKDPRWQKRRLEIMNRDEWACLYCGTTTENLQVHHRVYYKGRDPWDYGSSDLLTLCWKCHKKEHEQIPDEEYTRKYEHLILYKETPPILVSIDSQIYQLQNKLLEPIEDGLMEEILKNIMFLQTRKRELLNGKGTPLLPV